VVRDTQGNLETRAGMLRAFVTRRSGAPFRGTGREYQYRVLAQHPDDRGGGFETVVLVDDGDCSNEEEAIDLARAVMTSWTLRALAALKQPYEVIIRG
jgi:hypothetical protein